jgi:hypothetical protein
MSFLNPWLLAGALGAAVPVWLHLRRRKAPARLFSALLFLDDVPLARRDGLRPRDLLLLALRLAALLLLVGAFAWPYLRRPESRVTESVVYILDNTLSQQADGGFEGSRAGALAALRGADAQTQVAVVELRSRPRVVAAFTDARPEALRQVQALAPSYERGSYLDAFRMAQSLLEQSLGSRKRIVADGDRQENQWAENESSPPFLRDIAVSLPARELPKSRPNLSLGDPVARLFFLGDRTFVDFSIQLRHAGPATRARVRLEANGREILHDDVDLDHGSDLLTLRAQWETKPTEFLAGSMRLEGADDALPADDAAWFCLPPVREGRIALLARSPYLRAALSPETMRGRWQAAPVDLGNPAFADVAERDLADVMVVEASYAQSDRVRSLLLRHLNNGRGALVFLDRSTPLLAGLLGELGLASDGESEAPDGVRFVATDHPVFRPFLNGELGDVTAVRVSRHVRLRGKDAQPLLFGTSGDTLLLEGTSTRGRLLVFAFGLDRAHTDWGVQPSFLPFLDLALQHARSGTPVETSAEAGGAILHELPPGRTAKELVLRQDRREIARAAFDEARRARLQAPGTPGFYTIGYDAAPAVEAMIAVNPSPRESVLRYVQDPPALAAWRIASATPAAAKPAEAGSASASHAFDQRLWWVLLLAAAAVFLLEDLHLIVQRRVRP